MQVSGYFENFTNGVRLVSEDQVEWWERSFSPLSMMPKDICDLLTDGLPGDRDRHVDRIAPYKERADLIVSGTDADGRIFHTGRSFHFAHRCINLDMADVREDVQKRGYGRTLARNSYRLAVALGFDRLTLTALQVGSYSWARLGFMPTPDSWQAPKCRQKIQTSLASLRNQISSDLYLEVLDYAISDHPEVIWEIADKDAMVDSGKTVRRVPLGVALLYDSGASWHGTIELRHCETRTKQIERVRDYLALGANE